MTHEQGSEHLIRYGGEFADELIDGRDGKLAHHRGRPAHPRLHLRPDVRHPRPRPPGDPRALSDASGRVVHLFSGFLSRDVVELARELMATLPAPLARAMFLSTGGEANEAALRLAKLHTGGHEVLAFAGSWHGMTAGAASSTYSAGRRGYGPALPGTMVLPTPNPYRCPIRHCRDRCDFTCLDTGMALADTQSIGAPAAVIAEPILSAGGIVPLPAGYLAASAALRAARDAADPGRGADRARPGRRDVRVRAARRRAGHPHAVQDARRGLPLSATVTTDAIEEDAAAKGFLHFTSHVCDPLPAAVGRAVLRTVLAEGLGAARGALGARLRTGLDELRRRHEPIGDVRGAACCSASTWWPTGRPGPAAALLHGRHRALPRARRERQHRQVPGLRQRAADRAAAHDLADDIDLGLEILDRALADCR